MNRRHDTYPSFGLQTLGFFATPVAVALDWKAKMQEFLITHPVASGVINSVRNTLG